MTMNCLMTSAKLSLCATALLGAAACSQQGLRSTEVGTASRGALQRVASFGTNPGGLNMYKYVPANPVANAPLVVAMHACSQNAAAYENAGWNALADQHGFYVLYPEQSTSNNALSCFNWGGEGPSAARDAANLTRGQGENQSIIQMIDKMAEDHAIDVDRVFIMGHSGGGAQTALMLAVWPDRFAGGGIIAGIPYYCTIEFNEVITCLSPGKDHTPQQWGDLARMGYPGYSGPWPKLTIWHGQSDFTVANRNQTEILEQFSDLYGIDRTADSSGNIGTAQVTNYADGAGNTLVQTVNIPGFGHATPNDPGNGCGSSGPYFSDVGICAVQEMADFWGLLGGVNPGDTTPPTVDVTSPANGATVMGPVTVTLTAADDTAVTRVELFINGALATTLTGAPYQYVWNTSALASGAYALRAVAHDAAGNTGTDDDTSVIVDSTVTDTQPPTVQITAPADGATVMGQVTLTANATDDFGVSEVEFLLDGVRLAVATSPPYTVIWDATVADNKTYAIAAQARDAAGNQSEAMISVTVEGGMLPDTTPPVVSFTNPADGQVVSGVIRIQAEASDATRVAVVFLQIDGLRAGTGIFPPYNFIWDTSLVPTGTHTLSLTALDAASNAGVASIVVDVQRAAGPDPQTPGTNPGDSRWGCTATPGGAEPLLSFGLLAAAVLMARQRRRRSSLPKTRTTNKG